MMARNGFLVGFKPATRASYADGLKQWFSWCASVDLDPLQAQRPHIELWGRYLEEERRLNPSTVAHRLVTLRSFYRYCEDEGYVDRSPANRVRLPRLGSDSSTHGMTRQEIMAFLAASERNPVQHALVCLLLLNGLRISEACGADIEDLGVEGGHRTLRISRKGGKRQTLPLSPKTARAIDAAIGARTAGPLLLTQVGTRMTRYNAAEIVDRIGRRAGLKYHVHPHMLRHSFCTTALGAGAPLHDVQDSMGHADPRSTQRYNRNRQSLDRNSTHLVSAMLTYSN
jgi:site-specific recombinase XerD